MRRILLQIAVIKHRAVESQVDKGDVSLPDPLQPYNITPDGSQYNLTPFSIDGEECDGGGAAEDPEEGKEFRRGHSRYDDFSHRLLSMLCEEKMYRRVPRGE